MHLYFNLYVINGTSVMEITGEATVIDALNVQGGVYICFGHIVPIWSVVLIEFVLAYLLEIFIGSPKSFKIALKMFNLKRNKIQLYI